MSPDLFGGSAFRVGHILWCAQVSGGPPRQLPLSSLHSSSFLLTGSSSAACLPYRNDLNIRARLPSDFLHQPPRFHSANHPRLEEECLSCVLFFFFHFFEQYLGVVFWIAGGLSWSTWISVITLWGSRLLLFHDERFSAGIFYGVLYKALPY